MNPVLGVFLFVMLAALALASVVFVAVWATSLFSSKGKR